MRNPSGKHPTTRADVSRRSVVSGVLAAASIVAAPAIAQSSKLDIYLVMWSSDAPKIPWTDPSPRKVAEAAAFMVWRYVRTLGSKWTDLLTATEKNKPSVIGHAALVVAMDGVAEPLVFSNTGRDVGFYKSLEAKHEKHYPFPAPSLLEPIIASCHFAETIAGHLGKGYWESLGQFRERVTERAPPRVTRHGFSGDEARRLFESFDEISRQTKASKGPGGPWHFGLNTTAVRLVDDFGRALAMRTYTIKGKSHEIHGGCANAVASVLRAAGLSRLIPAMAVVERPLSLGAMQGKVLPVLIGKDAFSGAGGAQDRDLVKALDALPKAWGTGDRLRFTDPNYWAEALPSDAAALAGMRKAIGL